jgi:hypothetical protein
MELDDDNLDSPQSAEPVAARERWDKLPQESQRAFGAFQRYRDAERRSFKIVAEQLNCSPQNIFQWSSRFDWRGRCDAYDIEQDQIQRADLVRRRVRMKERHLNLAMSMQGIAAHAMREWQVRIASGAALDLAPEQIALLTKCSIELERTTMGEERDQKFTTINIVLGEHHYGDENAVGAHGDKPKLFDDWESENYETLSAEDKAALDGWKDPPKRKALN